MVTVSSVLWPHAMTLKSDTETRTRTLHYRVSGQLLSLIGTFGFITLVCLFKARPLRSCNFDISQQRSTRLTIQFNTNCWAKANPFSRNHFVL
jgi:hypothetical protein